jgi:hypothetical protein
MHGPIAKVSKRQAKRHEISKDMRSQKTFHVVNNVQLILDQKMSSQENCRLAEMPKSSGQRKSFLSTAL